MRRFRIAYAVIAAVLASGTGYLVDAMASTIAPSPTIAEYRVPIVLSPQAVGSIRFGTPMATAIADLGVLLANQKPKISAGVGCGTPAAYWPNFTAYFDHGEFVGYESANADDLPLHSKFLDAKTSAGLRPGDTVAEAERIYGSAFRTFSARGGTWSVSTGSGELLGYLKAPPVPTGPSDQIADIGTEAFGCLNWPEKGS